MKAIDKIQNAGFKVVSLRRFSGGRQFMCGYKVLLHDHCVLTGTSAVAMLRTLKRLYPHYFGR